MYKQLFRVCVFEKFIYLFQTPEKEERQGKKKKPKQNEKQNATRKQNQR